MQVIHTSNVNLAAKTIADEILQMLLIDQPVLWLLSGGSAIELAVATAALLKPSPHLTIGLVDERYGNPGHPDSNLSQLETAGFSLPINPVLHGGSVPEEVARFEQFLTVHRSDKLVGIFGMGLDGHTAGILPKSPPTESHSLVCGYQSHPFCRITTTPLLLSLVKSAYLWLQGSAKSEQFSRLQTDYPAVLQPAQYLKSATNLTIYTDIA